MQIELPLPSLPLPSLPPVKKMHYHVLSFLIISEDFSGIKTAAVGEPSAVCGFQSTFSCVLQINFPRPWFVRNHSEGHLSPENAYSIHPSALMR